MLIKDIELENVKSYRKTEIEFLEGVNGILGENGAGKSTILEAIGYILFDYLPYKKGDFLRRGEKNGRVRLMIEEDSGKACVLMRELNGSRYQLISEDASLEGKSDVLDYIMSRIIRGVHQKKRLPILFEQLIGVPQGRFNSLFLLSGEARKKAFERILGIDEYEKAYKTLAEVKQKVEGKNNELKGRILQLESVPEQITDLNNRI